MLVKLYRCACEGFVCGTLSEDGVSVCQQQEPGAMGRRHLHPCLLVIIGLVAQLASASILLLDITQENNQKTGEGKQRLSSVSLLGVTLYFE